MVQGQEPLKVNTHRLDKFKWKLRGSKRNKIIIKKFQMENNFEKIEEVIAYGVENAVLLVFDGISRREKKEGKW